MTDNELLAFAAKAVNRGSWHPMTHDTPNGVWNPLADDGDALRLAVSLEMNVFQAAKSAYALPSDDDGTYEEQVRYVDVANDQFAATRRAITRAAAEIGKAMP